MKTQVTKNENVVRSIDLGYGNVKFVLKTNSNNAPIFDFFPSIVCLSNNRIDGTGLLTKRDTTIINHNGILYETGKDILLTTNSIDSRVLNDDYVNSTDYAVLMKSALLKMNLKAIDILVVGAPVNKIAEVKNVLEENWKGHITLSDNNTVEIKQVKAIAQPLGGYISVANDGIFDAKDIGKQRNLIIDCGFFTIDWFLVENMTPSNCQGSFEAGVSFYIKSVADQIGNDACNLTIQNRIDETLRTGKPLMFNGRILDITPYIAKANAIVDKVSDKILSEIVDLAAIDNVILIGGSSEIYANAIGNKFKHWKIIKPNTGIFTNVRGYQIIGESISS